MKTILLSLMTAAAFGATPAFAQDPAPAQPASTVQSGRDGSTLTKLCSKEDPYIEYRDCVNASTRDTNAKVRMS